jgi:hypothetical protein
MRINPLKSLVIFSLIGLALAPFHTADARKDKKKKETARRGMLMPDLSAVLGDAWSVPPELSDRAVPGTVLEVTASGYRTVKTGCVSANPNHNPLTNVSMQNSLSGGVAFGAGSAKAAHSLKLSFVGPEIVSFELVDFIPSRDCVDSLSRYAQRGDVSNLVVVQEALLARVNGCEQASATSQLAVPGASARLSVGGACQMFSDAPVAVGVKTVALSQIPELAGLGSGSSTPPASASPQPIRSAPQPARSAPQPARSAPVPSGSSNSRSGASSSTSKWATHPLRGHDNDGAAFGPVEVTQRSDGSYRIFIANQSEWSCGLDVDSSGTPTRLVRCRSGQDWQAVPSTIPLTCRVKKTNELCTGTYEMWTNGRNTWPGSMKISRALDPNATWPW